MSTIIGYICLAVAILIYVWLALYFVVVRPRRTARPATVVRPVVQTSFACRDTDKHGVPWPVLSVDGMLVGWLCGVCTERRDDFKCPPIRYRVVCEHPEMEELSTLDGCTRRLCRDCGQQQMFTEQLEAFFIASGAHVPLMPALHTYEGEQ